MAGALLVVAAFGTESVDVSNVGAVSFGPGVGYSQAILVEAIATYLLVLTIFALAVDTRAPVGWAGLMIGLSVTCLVLVFGPFAGAALTGGGVPWSQLPAYVLGSLIGGLAAAFSDDLIARPREHAPAAEPRPVQGTAGDIAGHRTHHPS